jgi:trigger factor
LGDEHTLKEFTEALRGAAPGDVRELEVTYPEDYERKTLAGRTVKFQATVKAVRKRELPELNDEFAKDLGDFQTLEELRDMIRKTILREKESKAADDAKTQLLDKLVEAHPFPVPEVYIDRQIENNVNQQFGMLQAQGVDVSKLQLDWTRLREAQKDRATKDVKASLLIDKIADREALAATQEEVDKEVQKIARQRKEAPAVTRANLQKDGTIGRIANHIRTEKALNFLFEQSRKEAPKAA